MKICIISFKECWQDEHGTWYSNGGFPLQMGAICSLFDHSTLLIVRSEPRGGGIPLPPQTTVIPLRKPIGADSRRKLDILLHLFYYLRLIVKHILPADVVHTPVPGDISLLGMIMALLLHKRLIARYGGSWIATSTTTLMNRVTRTLMRTFAGGRNVMLATGFGTAPPAPNMHWIFVTPLSDQEIKDIQPDLDRGLANPPQLVYIGRFSSEKGVDYLIKALHLLKSRGFTPFPHTTLIGDGPDRAKLEALITHLLGDGYVTLTGQLDRGALSAHLLHMDVDVQPSLTEGFSKAWLDAMSHGLPVLSSKVGAASSVIGLNGERGWLVAPGSPQQLADKIADIIQQEREWPALRRHCRHYVEDLTLSTWSARIAEFCVEQWGVKIIKGKLDHA